MVRLAQEAGAKTAAPAPKSGEVTVDDPIDVSAIGIGQGRTATEAIVSLKFGHMTMNCVVELNILLDQLQQLQTMTGKASPKPPH